MSGHSKWANIRVRKTAEDAKRGKIFTRHARLIEMAARAGGDPVMNNALRTAVENARAENVPNANIERAIKKGMGALQGEQMAEILYAAYLPISVPATAVATAVACLIECLTDSRNRTIANIRSIVGRHGGNFADTNAVAWMFERRGVVVFQGKLSNELELQLIDVGAESIDTDSDTVTVMTNQNDWIKVRDFLKERGCEIVESGLKYVAKERVAIHDAEITQKIAVFIEALEADDDVVEVYTNADVPKER